MEALQAKRLLLLVQNTKGNYQIPDGETLGKWFSSKNKRIGARAANAVVKRLEQHGCIRRRGGKRYVNDDRLATEVTSCFYLLQFREFCKKNDRSTTKILFHRHLTSEFKGRFSSHKVSLADMYAHAIKAKYIRESDTVLGRIIIGPALEDHLPYLGLLLKQGLK